MREGDRWSRFGRELCAVFQPLIIRRLTLCTETTNAMASKEKEDKVPALKGKAGEGICSVVVQTVSYAGFSRLAAEDKVLAYIRRVRTSFSCAYQCAHLLLKLDESSLWSRCNLVSRFRVAQLTLIPLRSRRVCKPEECSNQNRNAKNPHCTR